MPEQLAALSTLLILNIILGLLFTVLPFWFICKKAGLHPALSILSLIPLANIAFLFYLAFAKWPSLDQNSAPEALQNQLNQNKSGKKVLISAGAVLLALAPLIVITGTAYTFTLPKIYAAQARIQINNDEAVPKPLANKSTASGYNPYFLRTQYEIIKSKPVLYEVINRLNLQEVWGKKENPLPKEVAYERLRSSLTVSPFRDTPLVAIEARSRNPKEAMCIANEVADIYSDHCLNQKQTEMTRALDALRHELEKQQKKVSDAEQQVKQLRQELDLPAYIGKADPGEIDEIRQKQLESDRINARVEMVVAKARLEQLESLEDDDLLSASAYLADDPFVASMRTQIENLDSEMQSLLENYGENHPEVKQAQAAKNECMKKLAQAMDGIKKGEHARHTIAKAKFDALEQELRKTQNSNTPEEREKLIPLRKAQQELEIQQSIMNALKARLAQEGITLNVPRDPVEIIDAAKEPIRPVSPNLILNVLFSVGVAAIFFLTGLPMLIIGIKHS